MTSHRFFSPIPGLFVTLLIGSAAMAQLQTPPAQGGPRDSGGEHYIVTFRTGTSQTDRAAAVARAGATLRFNYAVINSVAVTVANANALTALQRDMSVASITRDHAIQAFQGPTVPAGKPGGGGGGASQVIPEGVKRVGVPYAGSDGNGIGVVVGDTGIDLDHPDIAANLSPQKYDAFGGTCDDGNGHGSHVAGTIAALDNTIDVIGVAPKATLYCGRVLDNAGNGSDSTLIGLFDWIYSNRTNPSFSPAMRVVNLSLGRAKMPGDIDGPVHNAIKQLSDAGIVVLAAAGNDASKEVKDMVPAGFPQVLAVASTTAKEGTNSCRFFAGTILADTASYFSTDGKLDPTNIGVTISAPGEDQENINRSCFVSSVGILSLKAGGGTTRSSGTSMSTPHVSGVVARILQKGLAGSTETVRSYIRSNAYQAGTAPRDSPTSGYSFDQEREGIVRAP